MSSAPWAAVMRRSPSVKPGAGGTTPMLPGDASVMSAAISLPRSAKAASTASRSLNGSTIVSAAISLGTPAESGSANVATPEPACARRESTWPW